MTNDHLRTNLDRHTTAQSLINIGRKAVQERQHLLAEIAYLMVPYVLGETELTEFELRILDAVQNKC